MKARVVAALLGALAALPCAAQLRPCTAASAETGHKLLVDDIRGVPSDALTVLQQRIDSALAKLQAETRKALPDGAGDVAVTRVRAVRCQQRQPAGRESFTEAMARELNNNEVVLEVWAQTVPLPAAEGPGFTAIVGYALVPLRHYEPRLPQGVVTVERKARSVDSIGDLLAVLDQSDALAIYAAVGSGVRSFHAADYNLARIQLCEALGRLERMRDPSADDVELTKKVRAMSLEVVQRARADPAYRGDMNVTKPGSCTLPPL